MNPFDIAEKMRAFGFKTSRVKGNDMAAIDQAIEDCKAVEDQAVCLVLDTIKGQGVKYFEEMDANHSVKFDNEAILEETDKILADLRELTKERG